ncbi:unnamed protein product [Eruca vesicaria subsp. sativa]|uniref:Uncharacterized protein n=1 Tax=Eruca vesicaria subsp. sativa TaxID=29727 RepID=A0ABC8M133_ERUVS|nr:unnamed protein product [Eruca vesicaria subsp. sativa]
MLYLCSTPPPPLELKEESINKFLEILSEATSQDAIYCLNKRKGNVEDAVGYFYGDYSKSRPGIATAQVVKNFSGRVVDKDSSTESPQRIPEAKTLVTSSQVEESGNPTETLPLKEEESGEVNEEHIGTFVKMTGASREDAIANLEHFKWNVNQAVEFYKENGYSAELISALSFSLTENKDPPLPSMGTQSQLDASSGPMETESSLEKGGEGDVTVANPGMAKAHVKGKAVEEGSSAGASRDRTTVETQTAPSTIVMTISLADGRGTELELPLRLNQTIRDIRNAIDQRYPDNDRSYYLQSIGGEVYMDWDTTVDRVSTGGCRVLLQTYP